MRSNAMKPIHMALGAAATLVAALALGGWSPAAAQAQGSRIKGKIPDNFPYEIRNGRRVPKAQRVTAADGSWREEVRDGPCKTIRERTAQGEYRELRKCD
jgi:hypothetical protein